MCLTVYPGTVYLLTPVRAINDFNSSITSIGSHACLLFQPMTWLSAVAVSFIHVTIGGIVYSLGRRDHYSSSISSHLVNFPRLSLLIFFFFLLSLSFLSCGVGFSPWVVVLSMRGLVYFREPHHIKDIQVSVERSPRCCVGTKFAVFPQNKPNVFFFFFFLSQQT